jgi:hypothetical protein
MSYETESEIYRTVPNLKEVDQEKKDFLISFLRNNPGKFFTAKELALNSGFPKTQTYPELRKVITEAIELDHISIVSNIKGFAFVDKSTPGGINMIKRCLEHLNQRDAGLHRRINAYRMMIL